MGTNDDHTCPVSDCSKTGSLSQIITHISTHDGPAHSWDALGYDHSYDYRQAQESRHASDSTADPEESIPLKAVAGIGDSRAETLREAGYRTASDVAAATVAELTEVPLIATSTARAIHATAAEACGHEETRIAALAERLDCPRAEVAESYRSLASVSVPPAAAAESLRLALTDENEQTVFALDDYSLQYRHFLYQAGFETIEDVATASIAALTEAKYVGETLADNLKSLASERVEADEPATSNSETAAEQGAVGSQGGYQPTPVEGVGKYPPAMKRLDQWLLWKQTEDGLKVPRAPWETSEPLQFVDGTDPANWTSFADAVEWMEKLPYDLELAFSLSADDEIVFLDLDDVVEAGVVADEARELVQRTDTYATYSTSGTGLHLFGLGGLSDGIKSITGSLSDTGDHTIEVYDRNRFVAMTGDHLTETPGELSALDSVLADLEAEFVSVSESTPDKATTEPRKSRSELHEIESTTDIQDVFDAISQTRPADIRMKSTQTREHGDGTYSYDPSWTHSESGTRLAVTDDGWIYRKGMIALDPLQLVALEEHIITDPEDYPEGKAFWDAVEALRNRGAHIPTFEPPSGDHPEGATETISKSEIATTLNYGTPVRSDVDRYERDYQEQLALELTYPLVGAIREMELAPETAYRAAEIYAAGHAAGIVPGSSHRTTLAAAIRIAAVENGEPRPWADIKRALEIPDTSVRNKYDRLLGETELQSELDPTDLVVQPEDYVPYITSQLGIEDESLITGVETALAEADNTGGTSPLSEAAAALYAAITQSGEHHTQDEIGAAADVSAVTIRNNYQKYIE